MPKGSVLIYTGGAWHGSGANNAGGGHTRMGLNIDYNLGWLRQEENQYLAVPPAVAATMPPHMQQLVGYATYGT